MPPIFLWILMLTAPFGCCVGSLNFLSFLYLKTNQTKQLKLNAASIFQNLKCLNVSVWNLLPHFDIQVSHACPWYIPHTSPMSAIDWRVQPPWVGKAQYHGGGTYCSWTGDEWLGREPFCYMIFLSTQLSIDHPCVLVQMKCLYPRSLYLHLVPLKSSSDTFSFYTGY